MFRDFRTYGYSSENLLTSATGGVTLGYDLRLYQTVGAATTRITVELRWELR